MTEKGNFFFRTLCPKQIFRQKPIKKKFPISTGMWYNIKICYLILLTN